MKKNDFLQFFKSSIGILLLGGLVLRVCLFFMFQPYNHLGEIIVADAKGYHTIALNLIERSSFIVPNSTLDAIRTPIYPLLLAFIYSLFGANVSSIIIFQQLLSLGSVFFLYKIGEKIFSKKIGLISAIILCFEPDHLYFSFDLLTDTLFVFLLLFATLFFVQFIKENKLSFLIFSMLIAGLATLTRPISLFIPVVGIFIILIYAISVKENWLNVIKKSVVLITVFVLAVSPWAIRNKIQYDSFSLSAISGQNFLNYNVAFTIKRNSPKSINEIREDLYRNEVLIKGDSLKMTNNRFYLSTIQTDIAIDYIKENKWEYIKANVVGVFNLYSSLNYKNFLYRFTRIGTGQVHNASFDKMAASWKRLKSMNSLYFTSAIIFFLYLLSLYTISCLGMLSIVCKKKYVIILSILSIIVYFTALTGVVGLNRYKLPISPYYILFAAVGTLSFVEKLKVRHNKGK